MSQIDPQLAEQMYVKLGPLLASSVTPVGGYPAENPNPHPVGTGTLFAVGDTHFLVTAAQVVTSINRLYGGRFCIFGADATGNGRVKLHPVSVGATIVRSASETEADVALLALDSDTVEELTGRRFLRMTDVALEPELGASGGLSGSPSNTTVRSPEASSSKRL